MMKRRSAAFLTSLIIGATSLGYGSSALADEGPSPEVIAQVQGYFDEGAAFYMEGNYARAIVEFRKGHQLIPEPLFLYNIALAQAKLGQYEQALRTSRQAEGLPPNLAVANQGLGVAFETLLQARETAEAIGQAEVAEVEEAEEFEKVVVVEEPAPDTAESSFGAVGWTGVAIFTAGGLAMAGAGLVSMGLDDEWVAYEEAARSGDQAAYERHREKIGDRQSLGQGLLFSGVGLMTVGAGLVGYALIRGDGGKADKESPQLGLDLGPQGTMLRFRVAF